MARVGNIAILLTGAYKQKTACPVRKRYAADFYWRAETTDRELPRATFHASSPGSHLLDSRS